jgi:uncharacterized protein (TIGR02284 family)
MNNKDIANKLNSLLELLHDSHDGYIECTKEIDDSNLKNLFQNLADSRVDMMRSLESQIRQLGEEPVQTGSMLAAAHRIFIDIKSSITGHDKEAIIKEIQRGETYTLEHYNKILAEEDLPITAKNLLRPQAVEIENNLNRVLASAQTSEPA